MIFLNKWKKDLKPVFVSVGAGIHQLKLIQEARKLGFLVVGVDANLQAPGMNSCHLKIQESVTNYEEIYVSLQETLMISNVKCVLSKSYGEAVKTACYLGERFNIPLVPFSRIDDFIHKELMKAVFTANDIPTPAYRIIDTKSLRSLHSSKFPLVIKPPVGHAKKNVKLIQDFAGLQNFFSGNISRNSRFLLEEYIEGDEIIAAGIVHNGTYHLADISDKITSLPPYFVDIIHISPSKYFHLREKIIEIGQMITDAFDISSSPLIMELRITADENLYCIEAVPEFGGEYLPDILIPERTGYNFIHETINAVTGGNFIPPNAKSSRKAIAVRFITGRKGTISTFKDGSSPRSTGLIFEKMFKNPGDPVSAPVTNHDRIGVVITRGKTREDAIDNAEYAIEEKQIMIQTAAPVPDRSNA
ncbi:MAG TPA: ATP-grasp domain-containing protein [Spirochaetota bacterium]|nr:ATP-grasp domain-containing protein [Spirochaetota bacterium]